MEKLKHIETFKPSYTQQEKEELIAWFEQRADRLPQRLQIIDSLSTEDLPRTVASYLRLIRIERNNVVFSGYTAQLFMIREALRRDYPELEG